MTDKKRILCIDDEVDTLDLLRLVLERRGFEVLTASDGEQGLKMLVEERPDVLLLDIMMPDPDGWQIFHTMKKTPSMANIPVIMVTARAQSIEQVLGLHVGKVDGYITKPFLPGDLFEAIKKTLGESETAV